MNERVSALLVRLGADPALRARFVEDGRAVMNEAGLTPLERAELLRYVDAEGRIHAASISPDDVPLETGEGRIFVEEEQAPEGRIHATEADEIGADEIETDETIDETTQYSAEGRIHTPDEPEAPLDAPEGRIFAADVGGRIFVPEDDPDPNLSGDDKTP
jgi:hypothetical protein